MVRGKIQKGGLQQPPPLKGRVKALGLCNFIRVFGWAYKRVGGGGLYPDGLVSGIKKMFRNDEIKRI